MKAAKFSLCCLLAAISFAIFSRPAAIVGTGESSVLYARADTRTVYFYDTMEDGVARFAIPYTYCVQVLETLDGWYRVKYAENVGLYQARYGYCRKDGLTLTYDPPENIYLNMTVTVTFKPELGDSFFPALSELNVDAAFYGNVYRDGFAYSCVLYKDEYGYVNGANEDYPLNEIPAQSEPAKSKKTNVKLIVVIVLIAVAALALLILYFTGKTAKFKRT